MHFSDILFNLINGISGHLELLDKAMIIISKTGPYILMLAAIATYIVGVLKKNKELRGIVVDTVIKSALGIGLSQVISSVMPLPRPFINNPKTNLLYSHKGGGSFPSDHSLGCMSIALGLEKYKTSINKIYITIAFLVGFSRVYVGHHYPLDVIGGFFIASIVGKSYDRYLKGHIRKIYYKSEKILIN